MEKKSPKFTGKTPKCTTILIRFEEKKAKINQKKVVDLQDKIQKDNNKKTRKFTSFKVLNLRLLIL